MKYAVKQQLIIATDTGTGSLIKICNLLLDRRVNIQDIYATEERGKGLVHLIVDDTEAAVATLRDAGFIPLVIRVLLLDIKDAPGALGRICAVFVSHDINIDYVYGSENIHPHLMQLVRRMVLIMKVSDIDKAVKILDQKGAAIAALITKKTRNKK